MAHRLTLPSQRRINATDRPGETFQVLPILLRRPWLVEVVEPLKRRALVWQHDGSRRILRSEDWLLELGRLADRRWTTEGSIHGDETSRGPPSQRATLTRSTKTTTGVPMVGIRTSSIKRDDFEERRDWFQESVRFAMLRRALLEAENTFCAPATRRRRRARYVPQSRESHVRRLDHSLRWHRPEEGSAASQKTIRTRSRATAFWPDGLSWVGHSRARPPPALRRNQNAAGHHQSPHFHRWASLKPSEWLWGVVADGRRSGPSHYQPLSHRAGFRDITPAMKTSIDHLPDDQQRNYRPLQLCSQADVAIPIDMLILFGSRARGDWVDDQETGYKVTDLLVVVENEQQMNDLTVWDLERKVREIIGDTPLTFIVHDIKFVNKEIQVDSTSSAISQMKGDALRQTALFPRETESAECSGTARAGGTEF